MSELKKLILDGWRLFTDFIAYVFSWAIDQIAKLFDWQYLTSLAGWKFIFALLIVALVIFWLWRDIVILALALWNTLKSIVILGVVVFLVLLFLSAAPNDLIVLK